ncbi:MAG: ASCH domain-containing protein [Phycisphaeraceae bacterium]|nr:ASCH domain-containing protein [Phycisphaeraceae bacterium]
MDRGHLPTEPIRVMRTKTLQALSVVRPWGGKIATGEKTIEVRRWTPPVLPLNNLLIVENGRRLKPGECDADGLAVAVVSIGSVGDWTPELAEAACSPWEPGWLAWTIGDVKPIEHPFVVVAAREIYWIEVDSSRLPTGVA